MRIEEFYDKYIDEFNEFFEVGWKENLPELVIMENDKVADEVFEEQLESKRESWQIGWVRGTEKVYVLDKKHCKMVKSDEDYLFLIKHELAHSFTLFYCMQKRFNCQKLPRWLWEGVAIFLSEQPKQSSELSRFLESYDSYEEGLYQEAGIAIAMLVKKFGKGKLLEFVSGCSKIKDREEFEKLFEEIYGFELNYKNINDLEKGE